MRPSAAQLLQHERLELALKVSEAQKLFVSLLPSYIINVTCKLTETQRLDTVKRHKAGLEGRERNLAARESALSDKETQLATMLAQKDEEIGTLRSAMSTAENMLQVRINEALARREHDLRAMLLKQEQEVAARMAQRELEIQEAVRTREEELGRMWMEWEKQTREGMIKAVEERMQWVQDQAEELEKERERLDAVKCELERKMSALEEATVEKKGTVTGEFLWLIARS